MRKIPTVFLRDKADRARVTREPNPECAWLFCEVENGVEWRAFRKWDGTACMVRDGRLYARFDAKHGKAPPPGFEPAQDPDPVTGHWPGWVEVEDQPEYKWHRAALAGALRNGTYELVGPRVNGNPDRFDDHRFVSHGEGTPQASALEGPEQITYDLCAAVLAELPWEGVVFHHYDGVRMAKIKRRDFGLAWPIKAVRP